MSADNAIFVREINGDWYIKEGAMSSEKPWTDEWYDDADRFSYRADALDHAHNLMDEYGVVEYGVHIVEGYA
jgi:hypothetical protein